MVVEHSETWDKLDFSTFCWVFFFVVSFSWSSINCSTEFMSANLEAMTLGKHETLETFTLNYFAWPPRKGGKKTRIFSLVKKIVSGFWWLIRYFSLVRIIVWPMRLLLINERLFLFGDFALSKSQYLYMIMPILVFWLFFNCTQLLNSIKVNKRRRNMSVCNYMNCCFLVICILLVHTKKQKNCAGKNTAYVLHKAHETSDHSSRTFKMTNLRLGRRFNRTLFI